MPVAVLVFPFPSVQVSVAVYVADIDSVKSADTSPVMLGVTGTAVCPFTPSVPEEPMAIVPVTRIWKPGVDESASAPGPNVPLVVTAQPGSARATWMLIVAPGVEAVFSGTPSFTNSAKRS